MTAPRQWSDLAPRVISGLVLALVGAVVLYLGAAPFRAAIFLACGLMIWEVARMFGASHPVALGVLSAAALGLSELLSAILLSTLVVGPLLLAVVLSAAGQVTSDRLRFALYVGWILVGSYALLMLRTADGLGWALWLVTVVVTTDVAGYFAGRAFGGPKFWPAISPKKTWSGTIAGWIGAAVVGLLFSGGATQAGWVLIPLSVITSFAGQMGDIAQSAAKRHKGVKDSSNLIPGHGGVFDRFDALLGASVFLIPFWILGWALGAG